MKQSVCSQLTKNRWCDYYTINLWFDRTCHRGIDKNYSSKWKKSKSVKTGKIGDTGKHLPGEKKWYYSSNLLTMKAICYTGSAILPPKYF